MNSHDGITHFRLGRIRNLIVTSNSSVPAPKDFNAYEHATKALFMFVGEIQAFTIKCEHRILNDTIDRFGEKIIIQASDEDTFTAIVKATTSGMRLRAFHYVETCQVLSPEWLVEDVKIAIRTGMRKYGIEQKC